MTKWIMAVMFLILSLIVAVVILTITDVIHPQDKLRGYVESISWVAPYVEVYNIGLESQEWSEQEQLRLTGAWDEIHRMEQELANQKKELAEWESRLARQEQLLADAKNKSQSLANLAALYGKMRPEEVADILILLDNSQALDIILALDDETAALILGLLPSALAAELSSQFY